LVVIPRGLHLVVGFDVGLGELSLEGDEDLKQCVALLVREVVAWLPILIDTADKAQAEARVVEPRCV
jgi:hypothetical protein